MVVSKIVSGLDKIDFLSIGVFCTPLKEVQVTIIQNSKIKLLS